jgi:hypothetical protein
MSALPQGSCKKVSGISHADMIILTSSQPAAQVSALPLQAAAVKQVDGLQFVLMWTKRFQGLKGTKR